MSFRTEEGPEQQSLPYAADEEYVHRCIETALGKAVSLTFTENAISMISVRRKKETIAVRVHRMFLGAGTPVIREIAEFIRNGKGKTPLVRSFIRQNIGFLKKAEPRRRRARISGKCHDLLDIFRRVNEAYFDNRVTAEIAWGIRTGRRVVRRRTLGSYNSRSHLVTINPTLDRRSVPRYFVEFIVYHEMLHADMGVEKRNGRRSVHPKAFRARERLFRDYERAISWEKKWTGII